MALALEALCSGLRFTVGGGIRKKPSKFSINPRQSLCLVNISLASNSVNHYTFEERYFNG
ncbi:Uncharacterised protein [Citrobacter werkmanii]|uniref:Uncharacterized protein n=1 Tax=Citrobacter werkmanii TaxID=67827 RepID=A0A9N8CUF8_9ENTR|nr:Uncharacterised protein [Citrobacter werkmanii]CAB5593412.1 Uncharacterised protein [Citrobacter werkmanii]CAB5596529.1 Uncharacterised protein [Citrobacter werkmanii]CAB5607269.1 Uncharacterised protein [Citrobacter werkmanii]CAB5614276.1 Uncharacterised protein [Citrobacter werkmanii]